MYDRGMEWLNYHHLLYFWVTAREGSVSRACVELGLAQPTVSGQIRALEKSLGERLFRKAGRNLEMTETGRLVYSYADEIFGLGRELQSALKGRPRDRPMRFVVGVADVLPKLVVHRLLEAAYRLPGPVRLVCHEDKPERLLAALSLHDLDLVLSDQPVPPAVKVRAYNHLLGECGVSFFAAPALAGRLRPDFPRSLSGAPFLMPGENTVLRRSLEAWLGANGLYPVIRGEFADMALLKVFGQAGEGAFAAPSAVETEVRRQYDVALVGRTEEARERFYAISVDRRVKHPAVVAIRDAARSELFAPRGASGPG